MLTHSQTIATYLWLRRRRQFRSKRRYYVRPAHLHDIEDSFRIFQRYYESDDLMDLRGFCRLSPEEFDNLYARIEDQISRHSITHLRPINGQQRLAIFLR